MHAHWQSRQIFPKRAIIAGVTLLSLGRAAEALACFDRVLKQHPQLATLHNNRATALLALKRPEEALSAADSALHLQQLPDAFFNRGSALAALDRCEEALSCFEQALAREPQHVDALVYRGIVLERLDRPAEALDSYDAALRIRPGDSDILFNRTSALAALGRFNEAPRITAASSRPIRISNMRKDRGCSRSYNAVIGKTSPPAIHRSCAPARRISRFPAASGRSQC